MPSARWHWPIPIISLARPKDSGTKSRHCLSIRIGGWRQSANSRRNLKAKPLITIKPMPTCRRAAKRLPVRSESIRHLPASSLPIPIKGLITGGTTDRVRAVRLRCERLWRAKGRDLCKIPIFGTFLRNALL